MPSPRKNNRNMSKRKQRNGSTLTKHPIFGKFLNKYEMKRDEVLAKLNLSELNPHAAKEIRFLRNTNEYNQTDYHPNYGEYYPHRSHMNDGIHIISQLTNKTPYVIEASNLCPTNNNRDDLSGASSFRSRKDMEKCKSAKSFLAISEFFEDFRELLGDGFDFVDYGNNCELASYAGHAICRLRWILNETKDARVESRYCARIMESEANARTISVKSLARVCEKMKIPFLHLNFSGDGGSTIQTQLKNEIKALRLSLTTRVDSTIHLGPMSHQYCHGPLATFKNEEDQRARVTPKVEKMNPFIQSFLSDVAHRVTSIDPNREDSLSSLPLFSDHMKRNKLVPYVSDDISEEVRRRQEEKEEKAAAEVAAKLARQEEKEKKKARRKAAEVAEKKARQEERERLSKEKAAALEVEASQCAEYQTRRMEVPSLSYPEYLKEKKERRKKMTAEERQIERVKKKKKLLLKVKERQK